MDENDRTTPTDATDLTAGAPDGADEAVARVRAADPAAAVAPDLAALRAAVDARTADDDRSAARGDDAPDELAARRRRRWTGWPARAAGAAAAALLVGGGSGYALGAAAAPEPAADAITVAGAGGAPEPAAGSVPVPLAAESSAAGPRFAATDMAWGGWGRTVFTSSGVSEEGGSAPAWGFDPGAVVTQEAAEAAAAALGVDGTAELVDGAWVVGARDGSGPSVSIYPDATASLGYYDPSKDAWACASVMPAEPATGDADVEGSGEAGVVAPDACEERDLGPAPSGDAATAVVRDALAALGLDASAFEVVAEQQDDPGWSFVTAHGVVDGRRTGLVWSASLTGAGLQNLHGSLAPLVPLGDYPVVSPVEAVERLGDPRFGSGVGPVRWLDGAGPQAVDLGAPAPQVPATPTPGAPFAWPVATVTVVEAQLGAALHTLPDGAAALLPTYELTGDDGSVWSVLAVDEDALDLGPAR